MTRRYEIVYIFDSARDESQINESLDRHHALLKPEAESEFLLETNHWGKRTLAYPIGKREVGHYVVVNLRTEGNKLDEFERSVRLDESIIRYLVVLNEGEIPVPIEHPDDRNDHGDEIRPGRPRDGAGARTTAAVGDSDKSPAGNFNTAAAGDSSTAATEASDTAAAGDSGATATGDSNTTAPADSGEEKS